MASHYLRKYGVEATVDFELYKLDGTGLKIDAASATGDITLNRDEAAEEQLDADAFVDEGKSYSLVLSATEMEAARIIVHIIDQSSPQVWLDKTLIVETYGNASAQHAFDLDTATQDVNLTKISGDTQSATDLKDFADAGYNPATNKVTGVLLTDTTTAVTNAVTVSDKTGFSLAADQSGVTIGTVNTVSATGIDGIWDEVIEGTLTGRQTLRLNLAMLAGKSSGGGTVTLKYRDTGDAKDRLTFTVDANGNRTGVARNVS